MTLSSMEKISVSDLPNFINLPPTLFLRIELGSLSKKGSVALLNGSLTTLPLRGKGAASLF
jgi:hypothetical protein